jgi:hypothetical protein
MAAIIRDFAARGSGAPARLKPGTDHVFDETKSGTDHVFDEMVVCPRFYSERF